MSFHKVPERSIMSLKQHKPHVLNHCACAIMAEEFLGLTLRRSWLHGEGSGARRHPERQERSERWVQKWKASKVHCQSEASCQDAGCTVPYWSYALQGKKEKQRDRPLVSKGMFLMPWEFSLGGQHWTSSTGQLGSLHAPQELTN